MKKKILIILILFKANLAFSQWVFDLDKNCSFSFGGYQTGFHYGMDFYANAGTKVKSMHTGFAHVRVDVFHEDVTVTIKNTRGQTIASYSHLSPYHDYVSQGTHVEVGTELGVLKTSNYFDPHLHLNHYENNLEVNPFLFFAEMGAEAFTDFTPMLNDNEAPFFGAFYIKNIDTEQYQKNYVYQKVDIIREARDDMGQWCYASQGTTLDDYLLPGEDTDVFSGQTHRYTGTTSVPYSISLNIPDASYSSEHIYKYYRSGRYYLVDFNKRAECAAPINHNNDYHYCRILTNTYTTTEGSNTIEYEEKPWHTNLKSGTTDQNALVNWEAEYPDGMYDLIMEASDFAGNTTVDTKTVPVDNFPPMARQVKIYNPQNMTVFYNRQWELNSNNMLECTGFSNSLPTQTQLAVEVKTSEPCEWLKYRVGNTGSFSTATTQTDDQTFYFYINAQTSEVTKAIEIITQDLAGNQNYGLQATNQIYEPVHRTGNEASDWSLQNFQGTDKAHVLNFSNSAVQANFDYSLIGENNFQFNDQSTPATEITAWYWDFDNGTTSTQQNPPMQYFNDGEYNVSLTVNNQNTVVKPITVGENYTQELDFDWEPSGVPPTNADVTFFCTTANMLNHEWYVNGDFQSSNDEFTHTFAYEDVYDIMLITRDQYYNEHIAEKQIYVSDGGSSTLITCSYMPSLSDPKTVEYYVDVWGTNDYLRYQVFYGDGNSETRNSSFSSENFLHTYAHEGEYDFTVNVYTDNIFHGSCTKNVTVYDPYNTDLHVTYDFPTTIAASVEDDFSFTIHNGVKKYNWVAHFYKGNNTGVDLVLTKSGTVWENDDNTVEFPVTLNSAETYTVEMFIWDSSNKWDIETFTFNVVVPTQELSALVFIDGIGDYSNPQLIEKGGFRKVRAYACTESEHIYFDELSLHKKRGNLIWVNFHHDDSGEGSCIDYYKDTRFRYEGNYKIRFQVRRNNTLLKEAFRDVVSVNCNKVRTNYKNGVKYGAENYYAGGFKVDEQMDKSAVLHACNKIELLPGFETDESHKFVAMVGGIAARPPSKNTENPDSLDNYVYFYEGITIFPNPNDGRFRIDLSQIEGQKQKMEIINSLGTVVFSTTKFENTQIEINLQNHAKGVYFVKLYTQNKIFSEKIIFQ